MKEKAVGYLQRILSIEGKWLQGQGMSGGGCKFWLTVVSLVVAGIWGEKCSSEPRTADATMASPSLKDRPPVSGVNLQPGRKAQHGLQLSHIYRV